MKITLLIAASLLGVSCSIAPSLADTVVGADDSTSYTVSKPVTKPGSAASGSAALVTPLRPAIVTPAVAAPTETTTITDQSPRRHLRIGLPGLFHVNLN
ncbi:MAG: hypothetical protein JST89_24500 [Cyanobacteria bacterium SZAS-4]|nr:hypothetical protein [Cyanobacteria bacterium SZAS-4]